jgi:predicted nucleic acid-binding Zn ribbon protein
MANQKKEWANWLLTRQRFHINDRRPPAALRDEREIGTILSDILQTGPAAKALPKALTEHWSLIVGEHIAQHTTPSALKNGVLTVDADHPGWLTEIRRLPKKNLVQKIMTIPAIPNITDIRFQLDPSIRTWRNRSS